MTAMSWDNERSKNNEKGDTELKRVNNYSDALQGQRNNNNETKRNTKLKMGQQ